MLATGAIATAAAGAATTVTETFAATGSEQQFVVPAGVASVRVRAIGAAGQPGLVYGPFVSTSPGGYGALVAAQVPVSPGETLYVHVAEGGGPGGPFAGQGGGASDVRTVQASAPGSIESRLLVAGGGGGGGSVYLEGASGGGGDAGSPGREGVGAFIGGVVLQTGGGGAGSSTGPGAGGALCTSANFTIGGEGQLGLGGGGGEGWSSAASGGGGGAGYWGGGGGEGLCLFAEIRGGGGGGGGGSSFVEEGASSPFVGLASSSTEPSVTISYATPATATPSTAAIAFATQPLGTLSRPQSVTLTNGGGNPLVISAESVLGSSPALESDHPDDFVLSGSSCLGSIVFEASCQLTVRFAPQEAGPSTAALRIAGNTASDPTVIALSGTGGALPTAPQGPAGASGQQGLPGTTGQTGAKGAAGLAGKQGPKGAAGAPAASYFCHPRQLHGRFKNACFVRVASGSRPAVTATVRRKGVVYAKGISARLRAPGSLMLTALRPVPRGAYTLVLVSKHGTTRQTITIR